MHSFCSPNLLNIRHVVVVLLELMSRGFVTLQSVLSMFFRGSGFVMVPYVLDAVLHSLFGEDVRSGIVPSVRHSSDLSQRTA